MELDLLARLRGVGTERPSIDPTLAPRLGRVLESAVKGAEGERAEGERAEGERRGTATIRLTKGAVAEVLACERLFTSGAEGDDSSPSPARVQGQVLDIVFGHVVHGFAPGADPVADAIAVEEADGRSAIAEGWSALSPADQAKVRSFCHTTAAELWARWPSLPGRALVRLQDRLRVVLAGGQLELTGRIDMVLGVAGADRAGTTIVDVKTGRHRHEDTLDAAWYALLETLREGAAPFQTGNYHLGDGSLDLSVVDPVMLDEAAARAAKAASVIGGLLGGAPPTETPGWHCTRCPALADCGPGLRQVEQMGRHDVVERLRRDGDPHGDDSVAPAAVAAGA